MTSQEHAADNWFAGQVEGQDKIGVFPANYVEIEGDTITAAAIKINVADGACI